MATSTFHSQDHWGWLDRPGGPQPPVSVPQPVPSVSAQQLLVEAWAAETVAVTAAGTEIAAVAVVEIAAVVAAGIVFETVEVAEIAEAVAVSFVGQSYWGALTVD